MNLTKKNSILIIIIDKFYSDKDKAKENMLVKVRSRLFLGKGNGRGEEEFLRSTEKRIIVKLLYDFLF